MTKPAAIVINGKLMAYTNEPLPEGALLYLKPKQEAEQEPVAWMRQDGERVTTASDRHNYPDYETRFSIPLYTHPQPKAKT